MNGGYSEASETGRKQFLKKYARTVLKSCRCTDVSALYVNHAEPLALCDDYLMQNGISVIRSVEMSRCVRLSMGQWLVNHGVKEHLDANKEGKRMQKDNGVGSFVMYDRAEEGNISRGSIGEAMMQFMKRSAVEGGTIKNAEE